MNKNKILTFVTGNKKKLEEAKNILSEIKEISVNNSELDIDEIQGDAITVAKDKAKKAFNILKKPVFVDDTSFECEALGGLPGVYIRYFLDAIDPEGIYTMLKNFENKNSEAVCVIAYMDETLDEPIAFRGSVKGKVVAPRIDNGFGFDLIFVPIGHEKTFSEMTPEEKNKISHRKRALEMFRKFLYNKN